MRLRADFLGIPTWHDCRTGFAPMLRCAMLGQPIAAAHGPIYEVDPAAELLAPFARTASESDWDVPDETWLAPAAILERACELRTWSVEGIVRAKSVRDSFNDSGHGDDALAEDLDDWTRAGMVLEIARRHGINVIGRGLLRPQWRLSGTVTGRFGCDPLRGEDSAGKRWSFNPLSLGPDDRWRVRPSDAVRHIAVLDFKAMDLCSMLSIVPGLAARYEGLMADPHAGTAVLLAGGRSFDEGWFPDREVRDDIKRELFVYAYGGNSGLAREFDERLPELAFLRNLPMGEAGRRVQAQSALAFRAALSGVLHAVLSDHYIPMFAVHDELVLDCSEIGIDRIRDEVVLPLEKGATDRIGVPYRIGVTTGYTYEEAKSGR